MVKGAKKKQNNNLEMKIEHELSTIFLKNLEFDLETSTNQ
jgi:hypothetical protein